MNSPTFTGAKFYIRRFAIQQLISVENSDQRRILAQMFYRIRAEVRTL